MERSLLLNVRDVEFTSAAGHVAFVQNEEERNLIMFFFVGARW